MLGANTLNRQRLASPCALGVALALVLGWELARGAEGAGAGPAGPDEGLRFLAKVQAAVRAGELSGEQAMLLEFEYGFSSESLPVDYRPARPTPLKCATDLVRTYQRERGRLSPTTVQRIDGWLAGAASTTGDATYDSPGGRFTLTYSVAGDNAVPATDVSPADGVPDFVERVAAYCDRAWAEEVDSLGFAAPPIGTGRYQVNFQAMNFYGYTSAVRSPAGATRITLHNDFLGFPPNQDPEGGQWGCAKVTVAHELKHATQYAGSLWSEGGWTELDATWMEDVVYDGVNDYYNYLASGSPIGAPELPLDQGGYGSYQDCVWQHWMSETWGLGIIQDLWRWRQVHQSETMLESYDQLLGQHGSGVTAGWPTFTAWNYATGARAAAGFGYEEAAGYPTSQAMATVSGYPAQVSGNVAHLAARFVRCRYLGQTPGVVQIHFDGADSSQVQCTAVIVRTDGAALLERIPLDDRNDASASLATPLGEIARLGIVVSNGEMSGPDRAWSLTVGWRPARPALTLSAKSLADTVLAGDRGQWHLHLGNSGEAGSTLDWSAAVAGGSWATVWPLSGSVPAGGIQRVNLAVDATGLQPGVHTSRLIFTHDGPSSPDSVSLSLTVEPDSTGRPPSRFLFGLEGNRPNPFNPQTELALSLPAADRAIVDVLDVRGRIVRRLLDGELPAGRSFLIWNALDDAGRPAPTGAYLVRLRSGGRLATHKIMLSK